MCSPFPFLIYGIVSALSEFKVIHILIILHVLFIPVPAVKISPVIIQYTEHPVGIAGFIFRFFIAMFAYLFVGTDDMAYETVAFVRSLSIVFSVSVCGL